MLPRSVRHTATRDQFFAHKQGAGFARFVFKGSGSAEDTEALNATYSAEQFPWMYAHNPA